MYLVTSTNAKIYIVGHKIGSLPCGTTSEPVSNVKFDHLIKKGFTGIHKYTILPKVYAHLPRVWYELKSHSIQF